MTKALALLLLVVQLTAVARSAPENPLSWQLLGRLGSQKPNLVFSPASLEQTLGLLHLGARGESSQQILGCCGLQEPAEFLARAHHLESRWESACALYLGKNQPILTEFVEQARSSYHAPAEVVDLQQPETIQRLNQWASARTHGHVNELLSPADLSPESSLILVNAVFLKASWQQAFDPANTHPETFHAPGGDLQVPTMVMTAELLAATRPGYELLELPYRTVPLALDCLVPGPGSDLAALRGRPWSQIQEGLSQLAPATVELHLPRFKQSSRENLLTPLHGLGFPKVLNLTGLTPAPIALSDVVQQATLEVDETGTEASAATAAVAMRSFPEAFRVNRPFLYLVRDTQTGQVLFAGQVSQP